jgi:hypothetical protein
VHELKSRFRQREFEPAARERLAPVLDQGQKKRYHDHFVTKSLLPMFGIKFPAPSQK